MPCSHSRRFCVLAAMLLVLITLACFAMPSDAQTAPQPVSIAVGNDGLTRLLWNNPDGNNDAALWRINADSSVLPFTFGPYPGWTPAALAVDSNNSSRSLWNYTDATMSLWKFSETTGTFTSANYGPYPGWRAVSVGTGGNNIPRVMWTNTNGAMSLWTNADVSSAGPTFGPYPGYTASFLAVGYNNIPQVLWVKTDGTVSLWTNADTYATSPSYFNYTPVAGYTPLAMSNDAIGALHILWNHPSDSTVSLWSIKYDGTYTAHSFSYPSGYAPKSLSAATLQAVAGRGGIAPQNSYMDLMWVAPSGGVLIQTVSPTALIATNPPISPVAAQNGPPASHGTYSVTYSSPNYDLSYGSGTSPTSIPYANYNGGWGGSENPSGSGAFVNCAGAITATFTWVPDSKYPNSPPTQVLIAQTSTVGWSVDAAGGEFNCGCSNGLGSPVVTNPNGLSGSSSGSTYLGLTQLVRLVDFLSS